MRPANLDEGAQSIGVCQFKPLPSDVVPRPAKGLLGRRLGRKVLSVNSGRRLRNPQAIAHAQAFGSIGLGNEPLW